MFLIVPPKSVLYEKKNPLSGVLDLFFLGGGGTIARWLGSSVLGTSVIWGGFASVMSAMGNKKH